MCEVYNQDGELVSGVNWGVKLTKVDTRLYPNIDLAETVTVGGYTGPRYVDAGKGRIGDVQTGRPVMPASLSSAKGFDDRAHLSPHH